MWDNNGDNNNVVGNEENDKSNHGGKANLRDNLVC